MPAEPLLADTHALLWYFEGSGTVSDRRARLLDAALAEGALFGSAVSLFEIGLLLRRGRLRRIPNLRLWAQRTGALGLVLLPLDADTAVEASSLPGEPPRDPMDQLVIAAARVHGLRLVTRDGPILDYAAGGHVLALEI